MTTPRILLPCITALLVSSVCGFGQEPPAVKPPPEADSPIKLPSEQPAVEVETEPATPLETTTPQSKYEQASDPGAAPKTRHKLLPYLYYGLKLELNSIAYEHNFDLNDSIDDELLSTEPRLSFAMSFQPHRMFQIFANVRFQQELGWIEGADLRDEDRDGELELRDAYVSLREFLPGLSVQAGRQRFRDTREWLFDEQLDAVRLVYATDRERIELSVSREDWWSRNLLDLDDQDLDTTNIFNNYLVYASTRYRDRTIAGYVLVRDGNQDVTENNIYYGVHSHGEITDDLEYWIDAAALRGRRGHRRNSAVAIDVGLLYEFDVPWRPSLAAGYARGSGDANPNDDTEEAFRQTGMQDNAAKFNGVTRLKYYGELLDPELSNLNIFTAAIGVRPSRRSSIDLVWHYYEQVELNRRLRNTDLRRLRLPGTSKDLGHEIDLIVGYRQVKDLDLELTLGYFIPGRAMSDDPLDDDFAGDPAFLIKFQARYNF